MIVRPTRLSSQRYFDRVDQNTYSYVVNLFRKLLSFIYSLVTNEQTIFLKIIFLFIYIYKAVMADKILISMRN